MIENSPPPILTVALPQDLIVHRFVGVAAPVPPGPNDTGFQAEVLEGLRSVYEPRFVRISDVLFGAVGGLDGIQDLQGEVDFVPIGDGPRRLPGAEENQLHMEPVLAGPELVEGADVNVGVITQQQGDL